eukprot:7143869-Pyramimonas_sp.AAC.1
MFGRSHERRRQKQCTRSRKRPEQIPALQLWCLALSRRELLATLESSSHLEAPLHLDLGAPGLVDHLPGHLDLLPARWLLHLGRRGGRRGVVGLGSRRRCTRL